MAKNYSELLKDPRWQRKRLEIFQRDNFTCQGCRDDTVTLHVHHKVYRKGYMPWEYAGSDLITLCESCHKLEESLKGWAFVEKLSIERGTLRINGWYTFSAITFTLINRRDTWEKIKKILQDEIVDSDDFKEYMNG